MATGLEIALVALVLILLLGTYTVVKAVKPLIVNAVVGLIIFLLAEALFGVAVAITPLALLIVALGGVPGAVLVLLLALLNVAFVPGLVAVPLVVF
jgi:hypothetical protein